MSSKHLYYRSIDQGSLKVTLPEEQEASLHYSSLSKTNLDSYSEHDGTSNRWDRVGSTISNSSFCISTSTFVNETDRMADFSSAAQDGSPCVMGAFDGDESAKNGLLFEDFKVVAFLGQGSFGRVYLAIHHVKAQGEPSCQKVVALKCWPKTQVLQGNQFKCIQNEKSILEEVKCPFVTELYGSLQDEHNLYMAMDFAIGGDLFDLLKDEGAFTNDVALFYCTEIVLAIEHLHSLGVAYRDLKPENLLINGDGHIKLADFGFAKKLAPREKTLTLCGTPEYMAPEVLLNQGHDQRVDWWSLGVILVEMLAGYSPFYDKDPMTIYRNIKNYNFKFPFDISKSAQSLIHSLLQFNPDLRLCSEVTHSNYTSQQSCASAIKSHRWFNGIQWDQVSERQISPPWVPQVQGALDTRYFSNQKPQQAQNTPSFCLNEQQQLMFADF